MSRPLGGLSLDQQYSVPADTESFEQYYDTYSTLVVPTGAGHVPDFYTSENLYLWQDGASIYHWADASAARSDNCLAYSSPSYYASAFSSEAIPPVCSYCRILHFKTKADPNSPTTVAIDTAMSRSPHNHQLPRRTRTSSTWPSSSGMVRPVHRPRTIDLALHARATAFSHKPRLFSVTDTLL